MSAGHGEVPDSLLSKIRGLLAKAEHDNTAPEEAEAYTAKAAELMAKYGIERARLADADPDSDPIGDHEIVLDPPYALDKRDLLSRVAHPLRCKVVFRQRWVDDRKRVSAVLFGFASDIDRVEMLFTSLLVQAAHALAVEEVPPWENKAAYRRAWLAGYGSAVSLRLQEAEERAQRLADSARTGGRSTALVLASRDAVVERAYDERFGHLGKSRRRSLSGSGSRDGYSAGQRADLGGERVTRRNRRSLGGA